MIGFLHNLICEMVTYGVLGFVENKKRDLVHLYGAMDQRI